MTTEEAIAACWWTTDVAETKAWGTTTNREAGQFFEGDEHAREYWTDRSKRGWTITVPRWVATEDLGTGEKIRIENLAYSMIVHEIERRKGGA